MTDAQTEARAIVERLLDYQLTLDPNVVICDRHVVDEAATALAAKDAELAEAWQRYVDANEARIDAEAALAETRKALEEDRTATRSAWGRWERAQQEKERGA